MEQEPVIISGMVWIPYRYYTPEHAKRVMAECSVLPSAFEGKERHPIRYWRKCDQRRLLGLPMDYGLREISRLGIPESQVAEDLTLGHPVEFPSRPSPRDEDQGEFFNNVLSALGGYFSLMATAPTGTGKTVCSLHAAAALGVSTLVIVDSVEIAKQWRLEIQKHLGLKDWEIGTIRGSTFDYVGKRITVAVIHNLVQKTHSPEFYRNFGFIIWDESQVLGARSFSLSMALFPARYRLTVTATSVRKDGASKMIYAFFGEPRVVARQSALDCDVLVVPYLRRRPSKSSFRTPTAIIINELMEDEERNALIVGILLQEWREGRAMVCVSDRIEHLQHLMNWVRQQGVPGTSMGLYTRSFVDEQGELKENPSDYLDWCKREAQIIFATYQMVEKAWDVPRLSSGIDATPRGAAIQLVGRIRRKFQKPRPRWWTIQDRSNPKMMMKYKARLKDYATDPLIKVSFL